MPIYEYKCSNCGNQLEIMQKISDAPLMECPKCAGKLEKQWSLSGFQFKGSGWYVSDYTDRGKEPSSESKSAEGTAAKSADSNSTNSESFSSQTNSESSTSSTKAETSDSPKTSAGSESTASQPAASKPEAKPAKAD